MKSISIRIPALAAAMSAAILSLFALIPVAGGVDDEASAVFGVELPAGYRDWQLVSLAQEKGSLNDIRAILGNDIAIKAFGTVRAPSPTVRSSRG